MLTCKYILAGKEFEVQVPDNDAVGICMLFICTGTDTAGVLTIILFNIVW
jgi:hypothetical protein